MNEIMRRVRYNLEHILLPKLHAIGYRFGDGPWDHPDTLSDEELLQIQQEEPVFQAPSPEAVSQIAEVEQLAGPLPLSLKCWYEEVGTVNFIGSFLFSQSVDGFKRGYGLDPLHTEPLENVLSEIKYAVQSGNWQGYPMLSLSPDGDFKYGYSGGGSYEIELPCQAFDGILFGEKHNLTFVNYLRFCLQYAGFPGLGGDISIQDDILTFLTKDLHPF